jgi:hypothetical protein
LCFGGVVGQRFGDHIRKRLASLQKRRFATIDNQSDGAEIIEHNDSQIHLRQNRQEPSRDFNIEPINRATRGITREAIRCFTCSVFRVSDILQRLQLDDATSRVANTANSPPSLISIRLWSPDLHETGDLGFGKILFEDNVIDVMIAHCLLQFRDTRH